MTLKLHPSYRRFSADLAPNIGHSRDCQAGPYSSDRIGTKILSLNKEKKRKKNENDKTVKYV